MSHYIPDVLHRPGALVEGRYRLIALVSRGRRSVVYRGRDEMRRREVAVKIVPGVAAAVDANRVGRVRHPSIVEVLDVAPLGPEHTAVVMEWVQGTALGVVLKSGPLSEAASLAVLEQLSGAVQAAHAQRVVHSRICPENVILSENEDGEVHAKLAGLDHLIVPFSGGVELPPLPDTPAYDPPEQTSRATADPSGDVYSLGMTIWHAVSGQPRDVVPFPGRASIRVSSNDGMPSRMLAILQTCSAVAPADRYDSADALIEDIQRRYYPAQSVVWSRRTLTTAATVAMVLLALVLLGLTVWTFGSLGLDASNRVARNDVQPALSALPPQSPAVIQTSDVESSHDPSIDDSGQPFGESPPPDPEPELSVPPESSFSPLPVEGSQGDEPSRAGQEPLIAGRNPSELAGAQEPQRGRPSGPVARGDAGGVASGGSAMANIDPPVGPSFGRVGGDGPPTSGEPPTPDAASGTPDDASTSPVGDSGQVADASDASNTSDTTSDPQDAGDPGPADAVATSPTPTSSVPADLTGTTRWTGEIAGRPAEWTLRIAGDGTATASSRTRIGSDWVVRRLTGRADPLDGGVSLDLRDPDAAGELRMQGTLAAGSGQGQVAVRGRTRGRWGMRQVP
ncbi:MAG: protein kinase [Myxococcota bacterium]